MSIQRYDLVCEYEANIGPLDDGDYVAYADHLAELTAERERADRAEAVLECGHPASLMLHSAETGEPLYCELCDMRSQRNDAVQMEEHYKAERDALRDRLGLKNKPIPTVHGARGKE